MLTPTLSRALWLSLWLSLGLGFLACERLRMEPVKNEAGEIVKLAPLWSYPLHEQEPASNSIVRAHLMSEGKVFVATTSGEQKKLSALDVSDGSLVWQWNDQFEFCPDKIDPYEVHFHDGKFVPGLGPCQYAIDTRTGQTHWRKAQDRPFNREIAGQGDTFYMIGHIPDTLEEYDWSGVYIGSVSTGNIEPLLVPNFDFDTEGEVNLLTSIIAVLPVEIDGRSHLVVTCNDPYPNWHVKTYWGLYDLEGKSWVFDRKEIIPLEQGSDAMHIRVYEGKVYFSIRTTMACFDLRSGRRIWRRWFDGGLAFSGFIVEDDRVIAHVGNLHETVYGLDAATGQKLWEAEGAGTSSQLEGRYLNGIVYFSGGSTGRIHAIDCETGETVWRLDPGEIEKDAQDWKPDIYVVPGQNGEKGRVVACTPLNAYCFEAYR